MRRIECIECRERWNTYEITKDAYDHLKLSEKEIRLARNIRELLMTYNL